MVKKNPSLFVHRIPLCLFSFKILNILQVAFVWFFFVCLFVLEGFFGWEDVGDFF